MSKFKPISLTLVFYEEGDIVSMLLAYLTLLPIFIVVSFVALLLFRRECQLALFFIGQLLNEISNLILKRIIREPRPPGAIDLGKKSFGMPSDHSQFMLFFATYIVLMIMSKRIDVKDLRWKVGLSVGLYSIAITVAYSRVYLGLHTWAQIVVGSVIGLISGWFWYCFVQKWYRSTIHQQVISPLIDSALGRYLCIKDNSLISKNLLEEEYQLWQKLRFEKKNQRFSKFNNSVPPVQHQEINDGDSKKKKLQ